MVRVVEGSKVALNMMFAPCVSVQASFSKKPDVSARQEERTDSGIADAPGRDVTGILDLASGTQPSAARPDPLILRR